MLQENKIKEEANMEEDPLRTAKGIARGCLLSTADGKTHGFNRGMKDRFLLFFPYFCYIIYITRKEVKLICS